jgi:poly(hydroxyalkanoate) granule-associated protein
MATRKSRSRARPSHSAADGGNEAARAITDSAQKIWLAGLGAFERARAEGPRMFDTLVDQGKNLGGQARVAADQALRTLRESAADAGGRFDKLEQVFEDRVGRSLKRLGVITRSEVADLSQGVRELSDQVRQMMSGLGGAATRSGRSGAGRRGKATAGTVKRKAKRTAKSAAGTAREAGRAATGAAKKAGRKASRGAKRATRG